jgi:hypothetical protein
MSIDAPEQSTDDAGPISVDDAVSLLSAADEDLAPEDGDAGAADDEHEDEADDQTADGDDAPDDDDPASEEDPDEDDGDEPAQPAISAPEFWSAEEKALFAKASPDVQLLVAAKTKEAEKRVYEAKEEAATARKEASVIGDVRQAIDQQLERAEGIFRGRWDGVDFAEWAKTDPQEAFAAKLEFDQEQQQLNELRTAQAATETEEHRQFLRAEHGKLKDAGHVLADPEKGREAKKALVEYATQQGYDPADLKWAGAKELTTLHKAMLFDQAQARLAQKPKNPAPTEKKPNPVRPAGPPPSRRETQARNRKSVLGRAYATGRMVDAVAALVALEGK